MKQIEATGKSVNDAIENGLKLLGLTLCDVDVEILQQKGLFRPAKVRLTATASAEEELIKEFKAEVKEETVPEVKSAPTPKKEKKAPVVEEKKVPAQKEKNEPKKEEKKAPKKEEKKPAPVKTEAMPAPKKEEEQPKNYKPVSPEQVKRAQEYLERLLPLMKIDAQVKIDSSKGNVDVDLVTTDSAVIGHRGEVLDAIASLVKRAVEESDDKFVHVTVDSNGYRAKREQSLVSLANRMANKCIRTGRKVVLEPMNNSHRKVIHATLTSNDKVITKSEGTEPNRRVVIMLKRKGNNNK